MRVVSSSSARARLAAANAFIERFRPDTEILVVGATRGAADDFVRGINRSRPTFGLHRFSLTQLASRACAQAGSRPGWIPATLTNSEALAARVAFDAMSAQALDYFQPVAGTPGFPRALAATIYELRLAAVDPSTLAGDAAAADLSRLLARFEDQLTEARVDDRAALFVKAADAWPRSARWRGQPVLLLDVPLTSAAERRFATAVLTRASDALATCPAGDDATRRALADEPKTIVEERDDDAASGSDLGRLRRHIFALDQPDERSPSGDVRLFSAPGEAREALEIARRVLDEAARGVRFDDIAVCVRAPQHYMGLLDHAFERAGVPAYFDRGTERPDPAGRAFVALLSCACEKLSAKRFDEYLSLGQVPPVDAPLPPAVRIPDDETYGRFHEDAGQPSTDLDLDNAVAPLDSDDEAIVAGTLRAPWRWEELIVESAVIGGVDRADGKRRWRRRLDGLAADYALRLDELRREEPESPRVRRYERDLRNLGHLRGFALPLIDTLADWTDEALWGEWLDRFEALAMRALRRPGRVLQTLAGLRPMASVGPIRLDEARDVLRDRLVALDKEPPTDRYGRVFVGTPHQVRGRAFRAVFVPGLAERVFPQRVREDPLLSDDARRETNEALITRPDRTNAERLLLRIAIGAATERLYLSYPRLGAELGDLRPRVPSFYALDVMRAITGRIPDHRTLAADAAAEGGASLAWPAPRDPAAAVDDFEHDLAVLKPLLESRDVAAVRGQAHYLLQLNEVLRRSVIGRWARAGSRWSASDGLVQASPRTVPALTRNRLANRPYSLSALQKFAVCPYQFLLAAIHRIEVWDEPVPVVRMDPLTRGSLFHRVQAEFLRALQRDGQLPLAAAKLPAAIRTLHRVVDEVAAEYAERLAPAIDRVWRDEIDELRRDLDIWAQKLADEPEWVPEYFEFSFGLSDEGRDPRSLADPVSLAAGFQLRGSIDLIERRRDGAMLRVTDHKTGKSRATPNLVVGGGATLQPVLYSMAVEIGLGLPVASGRLYYCTTAGGFAEHSIAIDDHARAQALQVLTIVDRAIEVGRLPAAPSRDACRWCDFRPVCGPDAERSVARKPPALLADLQALREMP